MTSALWRNLSHRTTLDKPELLGALGAILILLSLGPPWFVENSEGGIAGNGTGRPPVVIELWDVSPLLSAGLGLAAVVGLGQAVAGLTRLRGRLNSLALVIASRSALLLAAIAIALKLRPVAWPACCDQTYTVTVPRLGLLLGVGGATLMFLASRGASLRS